MKFSMPEVWVSALPDLEVCQQARLSRDPRFDGRFFVGVLTTGVYCRPICPARLPAEDNVRYLASAASAQDAGFRPCRRCRPEAAHLLPEWTLASDTVLRALRMIEAGYLNEHSISQLAQQLSVSPRHLSRLFAEELGTSATSLAQHCRAKMAVSLLRDSKLALAQVALHSGYGSLSRFNTEIKQIFQRTPSDIRKAKAGRAVGRVVLKLKVRKPYHFDWVFEYLRLRALTGEVTISTPDSSAYRANSNTDHHNESTAVEFADVVEEVKGQSGSWQYRRRLRDGEWLEVRQFNQDLQVDLPLGQTPLYELLGRVRRLFDVHADGGTIHDRLCQDQYMRPWVEQAPGLRVPGAWDGFETAVRAVLGQQVSVVRGTTLANKMITQFGKGYFPTPSQLIGREVGTLGMPRRRGNAIELMAQLVDCGKLQLDESQNFDQVQQQLETLPGIGPWTANYIRMRCLKDPNAFPDNDWVVLKQLQCTPAVARKQALAWQPWRAYALMYIWYASSQNRQNKQNSKQKK